MTSSTTFRHSSLNEVDITKEAKIAKKLIADINIKIPGKKILTLAGPERDSQAFDMDEKGKIGYEKGHELIFLARLSKAVKYGGGLIIRQFLPFKVERTVKNNKKVIIPKKNIYGISLGQNGASPLSASEIERACVHDCNTGKIIPKEQDCFYRDLPFKL